MDVSVDEQLSGKDLIKALDSRIQELWKRYRLLKSEKYNLMEVLVTSALNSAASCNRTCCGGMPRRLSYGSWDCEKSPTGSCVYNTDMDPAHDECLFCREPEERK